jgi:hypothetical protein
MHLEAGEQFRILGSWLMAVEERGAEGLERVVRSALGGQDGFC